MFQLERFYDPISGEAQVGNLRIDQWNIGHLRKQMSIVSQEPSLFIGNIRDNVAYGKPDASQDEIEHAAKMANIHDFIVSLPQGYDTEINNSQLSGGQRQRIAIGKTRLTIIRFSI